MIRPAPIRVSASTSIGRSACRNAPIAISTATCARRPVDEARFLSAFRAELAHRARLAPGARRVVRLLRRRHAIADGAGHRRQHPGGDRGALERRSRRRGDARGQSDQRRGDAVPRLPGGRHQPRVARRAGHERPRPQGARPPAHRRRGHGGRRDRGVGLRALFLRPDLCPARTRRRPNGAPNSRPRSTGPPSTCRSTN